MKLSKSAKIAQNLISRGTDIITYDLQS